MSYHNNSFYLSDFEESDNESEELQENEFSLLMEISALNDDDNDSRDNINI